MSKKEQNSFSSVISINPYKNSYYRGVSSFISQSTAPEYSKEQFAISYLNTNDFITSLIAISKNIPDEDIFDAINNKVYDELGLDQAIEYSLQYVESFNNLDEDNRYFHVFIVNPLILTQTYNDSIQKIKYIDVIIPAPLLLKSLYTKEIIESGGVHCFIYLQENNAFLTIYSEKEFLYTKSIKYSFMDLHERFCELYGERVDYELFLTFFSTQNLKETDSDYKIYFIKLYKELFANINDILTYAKRAFDIDKFEHVYVGSQINTVTQLDEMLEVELDVKTSIFEFNYGFDSQNIFIDQLQYLMHIYTALLPEDKYECNFTIYHRPPKFIKRASGKLIAIIAASFIVAFAYPITYWSLTYAQELQYDLLRNSFSQTHIEKTTREATIKNREADKAKSLVLLTKEKVEFLNKKNTLTKIHKVKVNYPMKAKLLALLTKDLNRYRVNLQQIIYSQVNNVDQFKLSLVSKKNNNITKLIEHLTIIHENRFRFSLEKISYHKDVKKYFSELKVEIL